MLITDNLQLVILFTDADLVMQVAINIQYPKTITRYCIFHIHQNLVKRIKKKLYKKWKEFISKFYTLRNSLIISDFDCHWKDLMNKYLYAFTKQSFFANIHSTQHVKSINQIIKLKANSSNTLFELCSEINWITTY